MAARQANHTGPQSALFILGLLLCMGLTASAALADMPAPAGTIPPASASPTGGTCQLVAGAIIPSIDAPRGNTYLRGTDALSSNDVWAVGYETSCVSTDCPPQTLIEHWDGTRWSIFSGTQLGRLNAVEAIASNDVWAVGEGSAGALTMHWDGTQWNYIPSPNLGVLNGVAAASANDVWAVGYTYAGFITESLILHWDGIQWSRVSAPDPQYYLLNAVTVVASNDVWAVGGSRGYGPAARARALHWDGTQWSIVPVPTSQFLEISLYAIDAVSANDIWVVGAYGIDDGVVCVGTLTMHWDGIEWSITNTGPPCGKLYGVVALSANDVWAVGYSGTYVQYRLIQHWDGITWRAVSISDPAPYISYYAITAISAADIWAVGGEVIEHWDGSRWSGVQIAAYANYLRGIASLDEEYGTRRWVTGNYVTLDGSSHASVEEWVSPGRWRNNYVYVNAPSTLNGIAAFTSDAAWAVGSYTDQGVDRTLIVRYNGDWVQNSSPNVGSGSNYLTSVSIASANDAWAVGYYSPGPNQTRSLILHGGAWSISPNPDASTTSRLDGVVAISANDVWAVGRDNDRTLTMHWDGSAWSIVPSPNVGTTRNILRGVTAASSNDVWAVGYYGPPGTGQTLALHWDGSAWSIIPTPHMGDSSFLIGVDADAQNGVWAVGAYLTGGTSKTLAMRWDGSAWNIVSSPNSGTEGSSLSAVDASAPNDIWAVGGRTSGGTPLTLVERFRPADGFTDVPPDNTFYPYVQCLACQGIESGYACGGENEPCDPDSKPYFRPNTLITREEIAHMVAASAAFNEPAGEQRFEDVPPNHPFYAWINRMAVRGLIGGYPCGAAGEPCVPPNNRAYFRPANYATRGQIAKIVSNAAGYSETPTTQLFEDVPPINPFYLWVERLASRGIMGGYPCGGPFEPCSPQNKPYFRWGSLATRGQTSKIVANTFFPACQP